MNLTITSHPETLVTHRYYRIFSGEIYLGYLMSNKSKYSSVGENWNFVSESHLVPYHFHAESKNEAYTVLEKIINSKPVIVKQRFGAVVELNGDNSTVLKHPSTKI